MVQDKGVYVTFMQHGKLIQTEISLDSCLFEDLLESTDGTMYIMIPEWDLDKYQDVIGMYLMWYNKLPRNNENGHVNITSSIFPLAQHDIVSTVYKTRIFTYYQHDKFFILHNVPKELCPDAMDYMRTFTERSNIELVRYMQLQFWYEYLRDWTNKFQTPLNLINCEQEADANDLECYEWTYFHLLSFMSRVNMLYSLLQPRTVKNKSEISLLYNNTLAVLEDKEYAARQYIKQYRKMRNESNVSNVF
ncbi:hypothetical protein C6P45_002755 [Maudiozyma exigua]|uniref:Uncharacterized protein n=1 Tax=Maudiozyma exigua TaxID=34358 RepID=A0A9P6VUN5_MAUEX|nr:hypothetical protein C6P45_002755 [Kazachstania exigua]